MSELEDSTVELLGKVVGGDIAVLADLEEFRHAWDNIDDIDFSENMLGTAVVACLMAASNFGALSASLTAKGAELPGLDLKMSSLVVEYSATAVTNPAAILLNQLLNLYSTDKVNDMLERGFNFHNAVFTDGIKNLGEDGA